MRFRPLAGFAFAVVALAAIASGCGGSDSPQPPAGATAGARPQPACPAEWKAGWQTLADRIAAPVYCPSWLPDPLTGELDGQWNNINSVDKDRSYLMGFIWFERASGELHVNLRGYPGTTEIPTCVDVKTVAGKTKRKPVPCFSDSQGVERIGDFDVTVYTRNRGADEWHVLYAWEDEGSLYTLSQHVAPPLTFTGVIKDLKRITRGLVRIEPQAS